LDQNFALKIMPRACTEDQLVEQPAIGLFAEPGWQTASALEETFGPIGNLLPRQLWDQLYLEAKHG
jgi:hypothetical protein